MAEPMDELAQQQLEAAASRVAESNVMLSAAHTAATRARDAGAPDFTERIKTLVESVDNLFADMEKAQGEKVAHRGIRLAERTCRDPGCPVHGKSLSPQGMRVIHYKCTMRETIGEAEEVCDDPDCPIAATRVAHTHY